MIPLSLLILIGDLLGGKTSIPVMSIAGINILECTAVWLVMRTGRISLASLFGISIGIVMITIAIAGLGTIRTPTTAIYILMITAAGLLFDLPGLLGAATLSSLLVLGLINAENMGWLPLADYSVSITQWVTYTTIFILVGLLSFLGQRATHQAFKRVDFELTERKQAEEKKLIADVWARTISMAISQSPAITIITNPAGIIVYVNPKFTETTGYTAEEVIGKNPRILKSEFTSSSGYKELWQTILSGKHWKGVFHNKKKNGELYWESATISSVVDEQGVITHFLAIKEDITEQKLAADNLLENERRYRDLFEAADRQAQELKLLSEVRTLLSREPNPHLIFQVTVIAIAKILKYNMVSLYLVKGDVLELQYLIGDTEELGDTEEIKIISIEKGVVGRTARTGMPVLVQNVAEDPDHIKFWPGATSEIAVPLFDQDLVTGVLNVESDLEKGLNQADLRILIVISQYVSKAIERTRLLAEARYNEVKFRKVIENSGDGIVLANEFGEIIEWNRVQERITGIARSEILGQKIWEVEFRHLKSETQTPEIYQAKVDLILKVLESEGSHLGDDVIEFPIIRPDGVLRHLQVVFSLVKTEKGNLLCSITRDITDNKLAREVLLRRDSILNARAFTAAQFLKFSRWEDGIQSVLEMFSQGIQAEQTLVYQNRVEENPGLSAVRQFSWEKHPLTAAQADLFNLEINIPRHWADQMAAGQTIFGPMSSSIGDSDPISERYPGSIALVPIFVGLKWWGFFVCLDSGENRSWTLDEIESIRSISNILGTAIQRSDVEKALRLSEAHYRAMLSAIPDSIYRYTRDGTITAINNRNTADSLIGMNIRQAFPPEIADRLIEQIQLVLETNTAQILEFDIPEPEGAKAFEARLVASGDQEVLAIIRNVSERARLEQMKSDFINRAAHDLRTPLTTATIMADLIYEGGSDAELTRYWQIFRAELKRETNLIEKLLTVGQLESNKYQIKKQSIHIKAILLDALEGIRSIAASRSILLSENIPDDLPVIMADSIALQQVFMNLLSNAVKFTPLEARIDLDVREINVGVEVCIHDTGIGIPVEDLPNLFQRFFRANNAIAREIPGTGVGLFIVKSIIDQHHGHIYIDSRLGEGTLITVWLPVAGEDLNSLDLSPVIQSGP